MLRHIIIVFTLSVSVIICELINKNEGSRCTWKEATGTCINIFKCESASMYIKNKEHPPICTFQGKVPVICCTDCNPVEDTRKTIFNSKIGRLHLTGQKANDKCVNFVDKLDYDCKIGKSAEYTHMFYAQSNCYNTGYSVSGFLKPSERPPRRESYLALLGYGDNMNTAQWLCAGSIISEKFILTSADCLSNDKLGPVKFVALGIMKRTDPPEMWQKHKVKKTTLHPEYRPPSKYHDIGLLEIETTINFSREVLPACLHVDPQPYSTKAEVLTWDPQAKDQSTLQPISLSLFDSIQCSMFYPPQDRLMNGFNDSTQICYGDTETPKDSCKGDSGAPLVGIKRASSCARIIHGVTSFDRICGTAGSSGMFTKVKHYVPWIESVVWH